VTETPPPREALTDNLKAIFENIDRGLVDFGEHNRLWLPLITFLLAQLDRFVEALTKALAQPVPPPAPAYEPVLTAPATPPRPRKPAPCRLKFGWLLDLMPGAFVADAAVAQPVAISTDLPEPPAPIAPAEPERADRRNCRPVCHRVGSKLHAAPNSLDQPDCAPRLRPPRRKLHEIAFGFRTSFSLRYHNVLCDPASRVTGLAMSIKTRQDFFFEKRSKKLFRFGARALNQHRPKESKFFCFFFVHKKEDLSFI